MGHLAHVQTCCTYCRNQGSSKIGDQGLMLKLFISFFQTPSAIDRFNPPLSKPSSTSVDTARFTSSNPSLVTGRHSPVYVAVPADRPPVKIKPRTRVTAQDTIDISTINELRSKLRNVDDSGYKADLILPYYMASSVSGQDEPNPVL